MPRAVFIDTWGWLAIGHEREQKHAEVLALYQAFLAARERVVTSDFVLNELITLIFRHQPADTATQFVDKVLDAAARRLVRIERIDTSRFAESWALRRRLKDKPRISFTDVTSMVVMRQLGIREVLTEDDHFLHVGLGFQKLP